MIYRLLLLCMLLSGIFPLRAFGQEQDQLAEVMLTSGETVELAKWLKEDDKYLVWYKKYGNKSQFEGHKVKLKSHPEIPIWLAPRCVEATAQVILKKACNRLSEINEDPAVKAMREKVASQRANKEELIKSSLLQFVHLGGLWPMVDDVRLMIYGVIAETHVSIPTGPKLEINLPSVALMSMPTREGGRAMKIATTVGIGYRLKQFTWPGTDQNWMLHINMVHAWTTDNFASQVAGMNSKMSVMGFSITPKKR